MLGQVGKLCAGKHPASDLLKRARNNLVFHWNDAVIRQSVLEYGRNQRIVWYESNAGHADVVHRLSFEVLVHALFIEASTAGPADTRRLFNKAMSDAQNAMGLVYEFFTAALFGYLKACGAEQRKRGKPRRRSTRAPVVDSSV